MTLVSLKLTFLLLICLELSFAKKRCPPPNPGGIKILDCTGPHECYDCGSACQTECATLNQSCPIQNVRCNDACYCEPDYARNSRGVCIPTSQCPPKIPCRG